LRVRHPVNHSQLAMGTKIEAKPLGMVKTNFR
jgi:hypothetical protein